MLEWDGEGRKYLRQFTDRTDSEVINGILTLKTMKNADERDFNAENADKRRLTALSVSR